MKLTAAQKQALTKIQALGGRCLVFPKASASGISRECADALLVAGLITFTTAEYTNPQTNQRLFFLHANLK